MAELPVYALTPFTLLDYPGRMACIVWLAGCNMRCAYCHNPQIATGEGQLELAGVLDFLHKRRGLLDAVVVSGGEATAWAGLADFLQQVRALGYLAKLDTNGLRPDVLRKLLDARLLDYVAIDYKAPQDKFTSITGAKSFARFHESLELLLGQSEVEVEVRTTVHTSLLDEQDVNGIMADLAGLHFDGRYAVQNFRADSCRPTMANLPPQSRVLDPALLQVPGALQLELRNF